MAAFTRSRLTSALPSFAPFGTDRVNNDLVTTEGSFVMPRPIDERFWEKVEKSSGIFYLGDRTECWVWRAAIGGGGYGKFSVGSRTNNSLRQKSAHRWLYEREHGPIPMGLELDHLCRVRICVRHVELVTRTENVRRGIAGIVNRRRQLAKTHCKRGHLFDEANTYLIRGIHRQCRACHRLHSAALSQRRREALRA